MSHFRPLRGRGVGVFNMPLQLGTCGSSKYRCNSLTGYVRPFKKLSCFRPLRGRLWGVFNTPLRLGTCGPSKNCPVFVPFGAVCGAYAIRPYDRVRAALQKTVLFSSLFGAACGAYSIRPYDRVCAILRNTDAIPQLGTCCLSKKCLVFVPFGDACGAYSIRPYDRVRAALQKTVPFSFLSGPSVGRI